MSRTSKLALHIPEMLSFIELYNGKKTNLEILRAGLIKVAPNIPDPEPSFESGKNNTVVTLKRLKQPCQLKS